jgi:hypothetical protein
MSDDFVRSDNTLDLQGLLRNSGVGFGHSSIEYSGSSLAAAFKVLIPGTQLHKQALSLARQLRHYHVVQLEGALACVI